MSIKNIDVYLFSLQRGNVPPPTGANIRRFVSQGYKTNSKARMDRRFKYTWKWAKNTGKIKDFMSALKKSKKHYIKGGVQVNCIIGNKTTISDAKKRKLFRNGKRMIKYEKKKLKSEEKRRARREKRVKVRY